MSARKVVEASTFKAPSFFDGAVPHAARKSTAAINTKTKLKIFFIKYS
jgi:hypothetical protein